MPLSEPIRIIHADDHTIFRQGFRRLMEEQHKKEIVFVEEASNGVELLEKIRKNKPDIVLTDLRMPDMDGVAACHAIKKKFSHTPVIAFSAMTEEENIFSMFSAGANGFLSKNSSLEEVKSAIQAVYNGQPCYSGSVAEKMLKYIQKGQNNNGSKLQFTTQEIKIIQLLCKQFTNKEIADSLQLRIRTIENYRYHLQEKIGARNLAGIVIYALVNGIVKFGEL